MYLFAISYCCCFELWCWRRLLRVPWTARRSNQSILKEISPGCSLEGLMLKQKLQYFGHLMRRADSFEKTVKLGKTEGRRRRVWQRMRWLDGIQVAQSCPTLCNPMDLAYQAPPSMEFSRQEYWSGLPFPFPGDLPNQGSTAAALLKTSSTKMNKNNYSRHPCIILNLGGKVFNLSPSGMTLAVSLL